MQQLAKSRAVVAHAFNPSTWEAESQVHKYTGSSRPPWAAKWESIKKEKGESGKERKGWQRGKDVWTGGKNYTREHLHIISDLLRK